ncbi:MAG TPA: acetate--CoA ligase family protein [Solirubrobacteraceae bacterium]|nr:acetate--CoA ligase family protein [Solirubrobacteraceae bacterium]
MSRDLQALFSPTSVAVVGASADPRKWGNWLASRALRGEHRRAVHLVNRRGGEILGHTAHRSLRELGAPVDLVLVTVPEALLEPTIEDALTVGAGAIVVISAGTEGSGRDAALGTMVRDAGAVLVGPNCLGIFDADTELELASNDLPPGSVAMISQSGNLALEISVLLRENGLGFSRFVSLGNQADLTAAELIDAMAVHDRTQGIALYIEDFRDGRAFARAARRARDAGKPVVLLTASGHEAAARAIRSHTGALASDDAAIEAACVAAGVERVSSPRELVDVMQGLIRCPPSRGRRVAIMGDGGGHGGIAASLAARAGLEVPELSPATVAALSAQLPPTAACSNPVDLAGGGEADIRNFERTARTLLESGEVDAVLLTGYFGGYGEYAEVFADPEMATGAALAELATAAGRPLLVQTMYAGSAPADALREGGVPVYRAIEHAVVALARLAARSSDTLPSDTPDAVPALPAPAHTITNPGYEAARSLLDQGGVRFVAQRTVDSTAAALDAAAAIGYPVALKALGALHKSDAGGVRLGLTDPDELAAAYAEIEAHLHPETFSVEAMAPLDEGAELLIGARWDARFGPLVLAGLGGVYAEVMRDVAVALAPVTETQAQDMIRSLKAFPLLDGARGRASLDVAAAADALAALSRVAATHPEIGELEINPLLVLPDGALGLDARIVLKDPTD